MKKKLLFIAVMFACSLATLAQEIKKEHSIKVTNHQQNKNPFDTSKGFLIIYR